ncbi:hypothetical protein DPX16_21206 [Anabarilius grahami]|uniref:Uncharacterized protein n=1 Tax=Anabarilius grahami TaxID=495550 RepID=A0A3N0Z2S3_ANAGA|nr:hypothetical protein DPX16_21206 [Anabarilius grahami]
MTDGCSRVRNPMDSARRTDCVRACVRERESESKREHASVYPTFTNLMSRGFRKQRNRRQHSRGSYPTASCTKGPLLKGSPCTSSSSYRQQQKESVASPVFPQRACGPKQHSQLKCQQEKTDLKSVLLAKKASEKRS